MKIPFLTSLFVLGCCAMLNAQQIKAPESLRSSTAPQVSPPPTTAVDKLAEEAQKSLFQAADKAGGAGTSDNASMGNPYTGVTTSSGTMRLPTPAADSPSLWHKDSVHKLAVMDVAFGGTRETVMIELFPSDAPQTVANFINRCESGVYNGLAFHRAIEGFLVQTGDPLTADESAREKWGTGGEDTTLPAEIKRPHKIGSLAMARRSDKVNPQRRSNSSQFYIALGNYGSLDGKYTVFGQVVSGLSTIQNIARMPVDANDCPIARIEMKSIKIIDHRGPLQTQSELAGDGQRYTKPNASRGFVGRFLHRVW
ncbi:MAG: peptidylprolyl isomerase [Prosthecobacter sp.]